MLYQKQSVLLNSDEAEMFIFSERDNCQGWVVGFYRLCLV